MTRRTWIVAVAAVLAEDLVPGDTYHDWGTFRGDEGGGCGGGYFDLEYCVSPPDGGAGPPWGQDDDGDTAAGGEIVLDPAHFADAYFDGFGAFDPSYVENAYIEALEAAGYGPQPDGTVREPRGYNGATLDAALFGKIAEPDADGDGVHRCDEFRAGTDPNAADSDGDGVGDGADTFPVDPTEWVDTDGDGTGDNADADDDNDELPDAMDSAPLDPDADDDGIPDGEDVEWVQDAITTVPASDVKSPAAVNRNAFTSVLNSVERLIAEGNVAEAIQKLENLRRRVDGCGSRPDPNDWIINCTSQVQIRALIDELISNLIS